MDADINPRAIMGANMPPEPITEPAPATAPDPFEAIRVHIADLYLEASNWCDGTAIENAEQAAAVEKLLQGFKDAIKLAEKAQADQIDPLMDDVKKVRERFYPLIGDNKQIKGQAIRAKEALQATKTVWANKLAAERAAEADRLRREGEAKAAAAAQAIKDAAGNIAATEEAEALIKDARRDLKAANRADKPATKGMRTEWVTTVTDETVAMRTMWAMHRDELVAYSLTLAKRDVFGGKRALDGFAIAETKVAI